LDQQAYTKVLELDEFAGVREQLALLVTGVRSAEVLRMQHDGVEEWIEDGTTELGRRLLQAHLDTRSKEEPERDHVEGADGVKRGEVKRIRTRQLESVFGEVQVSRTGYGKEGEASLFPLDAELNLPARKYSHRLQLRVVKGVAESSYDTTIESVVEATGGKVPKLQAEQIAIESADDFEAFYETRQADAAESTADPLIITLDGKGIAMRREGLREATRKAADKELHKYKTRLSKGEKRNRKRMSTVAAVYTVPPHERTAEMIMKLEDKLTAEPRTRDKRLWASLEREPLTVTEEAVQEAVRRDPHKLRPWAALVDGAEQQLKNLRTCLKKYGVSHTVLILDFIHVLEYLWSAAHCFCPEGSEDAEKWVMERALQILKGKASGVAAGIRRSATKRGLSAQKRAAADKCADYLLKYKDMLHYHEYLEQGLPIATGVIEGACRYLIKDRMDVTGARWTLKGAEAVLKLRSVVKSGDLDAYWDFHRAQMHERNHLSRYALDQRAA